MIHPSTANTVTPDLIRGPESNNTTFAFGCPGSRIKSGMTSAGKRGHARPHRELFTVAVGGFADRDFPAPHYSVWEDRKHRWLTIEGDNVEDYD